MRKIKFGIAIPTSEEGLMYPIPFVKARDNIKIAIEAEKFGYDSVWGNDHIVTQEYVRKEFNQAPNYYSPLITLASIAENTTKLKIATALLVIPFRNPLMIAKELATLDHLSGGRLIVGVGIGAYREEFESLYGGRANKMKRGNMLDESLEILQKLFNKDIVTYKGEYFDIVKSQSYPKPIQNPFPFYIGGNSPKGRERTAKYGQGWLPAVITPEEVKSGIEEIKMYCEKISREYKNIDIAPQLSCSIGRTHAEAVKKFQRSQIYNHLESLKKSTLKNQDTSSYESRNLIGTPDEICEQVQKYIDAGVTTFSAMLFVGDTVEEMIESMGFFSEEVISRFNK